MTPAMAHLHRWLVGISSLLFLITAYADPSQTRNPDEPYEEAALRHLGEDALSRAGTAYNSAVPLRQLNLSNAVSWENLTPAQIQYWFEQGRDDRHLIVPNIRDFPRRPSWLYPDDGCFARGGVLSQWLGNHGLTRPSKIFIFGNLAVRTPNSPDGAVYWWYHVVTAVWSGTQMLVLDPAIAPERPLELKEWVMTMTRDSSNVKLSLCNPYAYVPDSSCLYSGPSSDSVARSNQTEYLRREWNRLINLRRNPWQELGDAPPWKRVD